MQQTIKSPRQRSPRGQVQQSLGKYWLQKVQLSSAKQNPLEHVDRLQKEILQAMSARQLFICAFALKCVEGELSEVAASPSIYTNYDSDLYFPVESLFTLCEKESVFGKHFLPLHGGYMLHERFKGLLKWITNQGLMYGLSKNLMLIIYWHPQSAKDNTENTLYKEVLSLWISVPNSDIFSKHRKGIKKAMEAGQHFAVICYLFEHHGYYNTKNTTKTFKYICNETRDFISNQIIAVDKWVIDEKHNELLHYLINVEQLQWSLRFMFESAHSSKLQDWCLLIAYWY